MTEFPSIRGRGSRVHLRGSPTHHVSSTSEIGRCRHSLLNAAWEKLKRDVAGRRALAIRQAERWRKQLRSRPEFSLASRHQAVSRLPSQEAAPRQARRPTRLQPLRPTAARRRLRHTSRARQSRRQSAPVCASPPRRGADDSWMVRLINPTPSSGFARNPLPTPAHRRYAHFSAPIPSAG
jgi:hypothetical protein